MLANILSRQYVCIEIHQMGDQELLRELSLCSQLKWQFLLCVFKFFIISWHHMYKLLPLLGRISEIPGGYVRCSFILAC